MPQNELIHLTADTDISLTIQYYVKANAVSIEDNYTSNKLLLFLSWESVVVY